MTPDELINRIKEKQKETAIKAVDFYSKEISKTAQKNFNKFEDEVSADADKRHVVVTVEADSEFEKTVTCYGNQVIFIEFGVGNENKSTTVSYESATYTPIDDTMWSMKIRSATYERPSFGFEFSNNFFVERDPRPLGVVPLGQYGKGYGMDDFWVRPTNGAYNANIGERPVHTRKGHHGEITGERTDVVWTSGHRPSRALYRAITSARRRAMKND